MSGKIKHILFVCTGNICRSPLAEGVAQSILEKEGLNLVVDSAGTINWHEGEAPCDHSVKIARQNEVDISKQRSRPVTKQDIDHFDYIVAIDAKIKEKLETLGSSNVYLLGDFGGYKGIDVPDPLFLNAFDDDIREIYSVYTMIESCVKDFIAQKC